MAFSNCEQIVEVVLPDSISYIGEVAFEGCYKLSKINFPSSLKKIEKSTFLGCAFTELVFTEGLETIGKYAFMNCFKVKKIVLPKTLKRVENGGLDACSKVEEIVIPDSMVYIHKYGFPMRYPGNSDPYSALKTVYFESEETKNKFGNLFSPAKLVVVDNEK